MERMEISAYPPDFAAVLRSRWQSQGLAEDVLPSEEVVALLLDTMYQASLLREESFQVQCRIIHAPEEVFETEIADGARGLHVLRFVEPVDYTAHNLRKLAAAAGYYRALLAVSLTRSGRLSVWGMVITGTDWVNHTEGGRADAVSLPNRLVIQVLAPGHLVAASGIARVLESRGGKLLTEGFDPFRSEWLPAKFGAIRKSLLEELQANSTLAWGCRVGDTFVKDVAQSLVRRALRLVRTRGHGGMLVYLPEDANASSIADQWFRFRVRFRPDDSSLRFRRLMIPLLKRVVAIGESLNMDVITFEDYQQMLDVELASIDDALIEFSHLLADLMSVDGSLVLDRSFQLIGFGAEIMGDSHVYRIHRALDLEANQTVEEPSDSSGTRHRSAYRLVSGLKEAIAVVVSQDGDVRFVAHVKEKLTYWPYAVT
jgi:hypothetical protein